MHAAVRAKHQDFATKRLKDAGYATGGAVEGDEDKKADIARVKSAINQHDDQLHGGKVTRLKLRRRGGRIAGKEPKADMARRARGGAMPKGAMPKGKGNINIILKTGGEGEKQQAMQQGMRIGAAMGARKAAAAMGARPGGAPMPAPRPPMGAPGPMAAGAPPGGMAPGMPGPMPAGGGLKDGGTVKVKEHARRRHAAERAYG